MPIALTVNGRRTELDIDATVPLLDVLRNHLDLKGTRYGCGLEQCGTCMVLVDGHPEYACTREVGTVADRAITTIEGIGTQDHPHPLQRAFLEEQAGQCGYCLSGILVSAKALLDRTPKPTRAEIVAALDRHLCRCGAYTRMIAAVQRAAQGKAEGTAEGTAQGTIRGTTQGTGPGIDQGMIRGATQGTGKGAALSGTSVGAPMGAPA